MRVRSSGILLHISSLPSPYGIGDLGPRARAFADLLAGAGQGCWQVLPLNPTSPVQGNSPYASCSAFAANPVLLSPEDMVSEEWLEEADIPACPCPDPRRTDYAAASAHREGVLRTAWSRHRDRLRRDTEFARFRAEQGHWLEDYALFATLKRRFQDAAWTDWPAPFRDREDTALAQWSAEAADRIEFECFVQYLFFSQWRRLRSHCRDKGVQLVGDMPIYVTHDSVDVWAHRELFKLDQRGLPEFVAGVPPDYFSATGQLWGNPVFDWAAHEAEGYHWWTRRVARALDLFDVARLDHFRGFAAYYEVPAGEKTAVGGRWVEAPGQELFETLLRRFSCLPLIAEDLGYITADVRELRDAFGFPGMRILQFGFNGDPARSPHLPHNYQRNSVVYTGTHDNNTCRGWHDQEADERRLRLFRDYAGVAADVDISHRFIRLAMQSVAATTIIPMQDVLGLGAEARLNVPGTAKGNWEWRLLPGEMDTERLRWLGLMTRLTGRSAVP